MKCSLAIIWLACNCLAATVAPTAFSMSHPSPSNDRCSSQLPHRDTYLLPDFKGDPGCLGQVQAHVHLGVDLVHVLTARAARASKAEVNIIWWRGKWGRSTTGPPNRVSRSPAGSCHCIVCSRQLHNHCDLSCMQPCPQFPPTLGDWPHIPVLHHWLGGLVC